MGSGDHDCRFDHDCVCGLVSMNERLKELAEQAEKYADYNFKGEHFWTEAYESKFAELIVKECIWALWTEECRTSDLASEEYTRGSNKIKQHFGVE